MFTLIITGNEAHKGSYYQAFNRQKSTIPFYPYKFYLHYHAEPNHPKNYDVLEWDEIIGHDAYWI